MEHCAHRQRGGTGADIPTVHKLLQDARFGWVALFKSFLFQLFSMDLETIFSSSTEVFAKKKCVVFVRVCVKVECPERWWWWRREGEEEGAVGGSAKVGAEEVVGRRVVGPN